MILDCTLRDGAHVNFGNFGKGNIVRIINSLVKSEVDIIELGFLENRDFDENATFYPDFQKLDSFLQDNQVIKGSSKFSVMIRTDRFDLNNLNLKSKFVDIIRFAFYPHHIPELKEYVDKARGLGFRVFLNPINVTAYTDSEFENVINNVKDLDVEGIALVDTFGALTCESFKSYLDIIEKRTPSHFKIGLHLHENLSLSLGLIDRLLIETGYNSQKIVIDGSLLGMGRIPGNTPTESIMGLLNSRYNTNYSPVYLMNTIEEVILVEKQKREWGYLPIYMHSGFSGVHRSYPEYCKEQLNLNYEKIYRLIDVVSQSKYKLEFNKEFIDEEAEKL